MKQIIEQYKTKKCDVCGTIDEKLDFVLFGIEKENIIKICWNCDYRDWYSTFPR